MLLFYFVYYDVILCMRDENDLTDWDTYVCKTYIITKDVCNGIVTSDVQPLSFNIIMLPVEKAPRLTSNNWNMNLTCAITIENVINNNVINGQILWISVLLAHNTKTHQLHIHNRQILKWKTTE